MIPGDSIIQDRHPSSARASEENQRASLPSLAVRSSLADLALHEDHGESYLFVSSWQWYSNPVVRTGRRRAPPFNSLSSLAFPSIARLFLHRIDTVERTDIPGSDASAIHLSVVSRGRGSFWAFIPQSNPFPLLLFFFLSKKILPPSYFLVSFAGKSTVGVVSATKSG